MKKIMIAMVILIVTFAITTVSAEAQCPTGYSSHTISSVNINSCLYDIEICYKCPYGPVPGFLEIMNITKLDPACNQTLNMQEIIDAAEAIFCNWDFISNILCLDLEAPNCPKQSQEFTIYHPICWRAEFIEYFGDQFIKYSPCTSSASCVEKFTVCYIGGEYIKRYIVPIYIDGTINCTFEAWEVDEPDELWETSPCFIRHTACNP